MPHPEGIDHAMAERRSSIRIRNNLSVLRTYAGRIFRPRPMQLVSQWADAHRILSSESSQIVGQFKTSRTPYLREPMDDLSVGSSVEKVVLMFPSQSGKTEAAVNFVGYIMDREPGPALIALPTDTLVKKWVSQRINPLIRHTRVLRDIFAGRAYHEGGNKETQREFPGGAVYLVTANSPSNVKNASIRYLILDEFEEYPKKVGQGGIDPVKSLFDRTTAFSRRKILIISVPGNSGESRTEDEYNAGHRAQWHVPCPHCGDYQSLEWETDEGEPRLIRHIDGRVFYPCCHCGGAIEEHHRPGMLAAGRWHIRNPEVTHTHSYTFNALSTPLDIGWSWSKLLTDYETVKSDTDQLAAFYTSTLGIPYKRNTESVDMLRLLTRLEDYLEDLDIHIIGIMAGVDVQKDRIEVTIAKVGIAEELWLWEHIIIPGDTKHAQTWDALDDTLREHGVELAAIDSGYNTDEVYAFCQSRSWCIPTKGVPGTSRPLIESELQRKQRLRRRRKKGMSPEPVGVDQGKATLMARLKLPSAGKNYIHFRNHPSFDEEYFQQLGAEVLQTKQRGRTTYVEWVKIRPRNEALDCLLLVLVAARLSGKSQSDLPKKLTNAPKKPIAQTTRSNGISKSDWGSRL